MKPTNSNEEDLFSDSMNLKNTSLIQSLIRQKISGHSLRTIGEERAKYWNFTINGTGNRSFQNC